MSQHAETEQTSRRLFAVAHLKFFPAVKRNKLQRFILVVERLTKDHNTTSVNTHWSYLDPGVVEGILDGQPFSRTHKREKRQFNRKRELYQRDSSTWRMKALISDLCLPSQTPGKQSGLSSDPSKTIQRPP